MSGIAIAVGGMIAKWGSFHALFITMGCISLLATLVQAQLTWREERLPERQG